MDVVTVSPELQVVVPRAVREAIMQQGEVEGLDAALALSASRLDIDHELPPADSIVSAPPSTSVRPHPDSRRRPDRCP